MIRSRSSNEASVAVSSASACSEANRALADAVAVPDSPRGTGEELALEVREAEHAAASELVGGLHAGGDEHEPARCRLGDHRAQLVVAAARGVDLDDPALARAAASCPRSRRWRARSPRRPSACARSAGASGGSWSTARSRGRSGTSSPSRPTHTGRPPPSSISSSARERAEHAAVADQLVADDLAAPVDHRPAHDGDAGALDLRRGLARRARAGRLGGQVAVDALPSVADAHGARVDGLQRAVGVHAAQNAGPALRGRRSASRSSAWVRSASERPTRSSWPSNAAPAAFENVSVPSASVAHTQSPASSTNPRYGVSSPHRAVALGELRAQRLALGLQAVALGLGGVGTLARRTQPNGGDDHHHNEHSRQHRRDDHGEMVALQPRSA